MRKLLPTLITVLLPVAVAATFLACEGSGGGGSGSTGTTVTTPGPTTSTTEVADDGTNYVCPEGGLDAVRELQSSVDSGHQPWRLSAEDVAAGCTFGVGGATVLAEGDDTYRVTSDDDGSVVVVELAQPLGPGTIWAATSITPVATAEGASCDSDTLLTATRAALQTDIIVSVTVKQCQNGYARVIANPDQSTCGQPDGSCYENEQVFLSDTDGQWTFLDAGTGIACTDADISAPLLTACEALGLR
jgi:hypothetical protein